MYVLNYKRQIVILERKISSFSSKHEQVRNLILLTQYVPQFETSMIIMSDNMTWNNYNNTIQ